MIESVIEWSIRNRLVVIILSIAMAAAGVRALITMPVDAIPDLSENQVIVFTDWLGRSPREIEDQVTYPLSVTLQGLAGVKVVRSSSEFNFSMINVIFDESTDFYFARQRVLERLSTAPTFLPPGVAPYMAPDATALGQIFWYTVEGEGRDLGELRAIQDWYVRYQLNSVAGVAEVASVGGAPREYQIDLDPNKLRAFGVTLGDVDRAVQRTNSSVGGRVIHQGNAEYLIRSIGWIKNLDDLSETVVARRGVGTPILLRELGSVQLGPAYRRSVLEKNGGEAVGGVVLMRFGENPLEVTRRIKEKLASLHDGLPEGVRIVPFYDRTPLITKAMATVSDTVKQELIICTFMIILVMGHLGGAFVVSLSLPLAVLFSFLMMRLVGIPSNIMSLAGIAISVGILEDQAVVMTENAAHHLTRRFGRERVRGDISDIIIPACRTVGRPIFFSVLITIISFLPVFALQGIEGKMFHPLAWTKTFALIGVAFLAITLVPALIPIFLRGRIKGEDESWLVRTMTQIFRPMLSWLLDRPTFVCWLFACIVGLGFVSASKLGREFMPDLDEGSILDMPTSIPRTSVTEATEDLRVRDAILRSFPEVWQVVGKAGRAETATDPAPLDMIETMINLRDKDLWPKRHLRYSDAASVVADALQTARSQGWLMALRSDDQETLANDTTMVLLDTVDRELRERAHLRLGEFRTELGQGLVADCLDAILDQADPIVFKRWPSTAERNRLIDQLAKSHGARMADPLVEQAVADLVRDALGGLVALGVFPSVSILSTPNRSPITRTGEFLGDLIGVTPKSFDQGMMELLAVKQHSRTADRIQLLNRELFDLAARIVPPTAVDQILKLATERALTSRSPTETELHTAREALASSFIRDVFLWRKSKEDLVKELDSTLQMPGWGNIWTQPIINRINMLATGVRSEIGVKVFGTDLDEIQRVSQRVAAELREVPGAVDVFPDQIVGKGYVEIEIDRQRAARYGINVGDIQDVIEVALAGKPLTITVEGRERYPVRVRYARDFRDDVESIGRILVSAPSFPADSTASVPATPTEIPLDQLAQIKVVEGPSTIKGENGLLRSYVQLNVRDRDLLGFVEEARSVIADRVPLPEGMYIEWAGEFENQLRARKTLQIVFPAVIIAIVLLLYLTYKSWTDAALILPSILGALAGGAIFQRLLGYDFSVAVWIGYIACFGMATETGIVMMVYLREAIADRGGLEAIGSVEELRQAVLDGAIHRLRPKLLTEGTTIIAIAPMLWADGVGAEVIRPMAAPVLGGLLIADEVIDIMLPVFYFVLQKRRWLRLNRNT
jgi:copper/silver efflux system protein